MQGLFATATCVVLVGTSLAYGAYDDPAVALCKRALKEAINPIDEQVDRVEGSINGTTVVLNYTSSILGTKPEERVYTCYFEYNERRGGFVSTWKTLPAPADCEARAAAYREWEIKLYAGPQPPSRDIRDGFARAEAAVNECQEARSGNAHEANRADLLDQLWNQTGIYPIKAGETNLRR